VLRWRVNGVAIDGAGDSTLTVSNVQYAQNGFVYSLVASNSVGIVTNSAILTVLVPVSISNQPQNLVVTNTQTATFSVSAGGVPAPAFQWYFNSNKIAAATSPGYSIATATPANMGAYHVVVSNSINVVTSSVARLTVNSTMSPMALVPANGSTNI